MLFRERSRLSRVSHESALASRVRMPSMQISELALDNETRLLALSGLRKRNFGHSGYDIRAHSHSFESISGITGLCRPRVVETRSGVAWVRTAVGGHVAVSGGKTVLSVGAAPGWGCDLASRGVHSWRKGKPDGG